MIHILLLDDHAVVRTGYRRLIDAEADMRVVAEAATADEACAALRRQPVNVAVVDLSLQLGSGMEAISRLLARQPDLGILVFTMHQHAGYARQAFRAGAQGYLTKHADPDDMLAALRKVAQGRRVLSPDMAELLANDSLEADAAISRLTPREFDILRLAVAGEPPARIAEQLHLSAKTVLNYLSAIRQKLEVHNDIGLMQLALRHGLVAAPGA
jgi:DNA-binding NarL/FixJ family response regulator